MSLRVRNLGYARSFARHAGAILARTASWVAERTAHVPLVDGILATCGRVAIHAYRQYLSPLKGYRCSHSALTGGPSCSAVALTSFQEHPFSDAMAATMEQFGRCRNASIQLHSDIVGEAAAHVSSFVVGSGGELSVYVADQGCCPCPPDPTPPPPPPP